jgi:uncharacterized protein YjbJ (UPF0337 family)
MSITDKITGRLKKAAGDLKEDLDRAHEHADRKAEEVADLERKT